MYINYINDRKYLGFNCLRDREGLKQVTAIFVTGVICIGISLNSRLFLNGQEYSNEKISNQESNMLKDYHNSGVTIQTGNEKIFRINDMDVILVKDDGILPGVDGFSSANYPRKPHSIPRVNRRRGINIDPPQILEGFGNIPKAPRSFTEVDTGLNADRGDQCPASKFNMYKEHQNFVYEMKNKGHFVDDIGCDLERFEKLSTNPETDFIDRKSINEAKTILQSEQENLVINARRPNLKKGEPNLDFVVDGPGSYQYVDVKNPIDPRKFPPAKKKPESFNKIGRRIGEKITKQKGGSDRVLHIVDLEQIPSEVKENITKKIIEGAGSSKDIKFIN